MKPHNKSNLVLLAFLTLALFATACTDAKIEAANKLVDSANKKTTEVKALVSKAADSFEKINKDLTDFEEAKTAHANDLKELVKSYDKILETQRSAASDFAEAAKLSANEKFKAYYEMSAKDGEKTAEVLTQSKELAQAILDSKDIESYSKKMDAIQAKSDSLTKESDDLRAKLKKLEDEVNALNKG